MNHTAAFLVLFPIIALSHNGGIREYPFVREVHLSGEPGDAAAIPVDRKIYRAANDDYSNIRILDRNGETVPFAVRDVRIPDVRTDYVRLPGKITGFSRDLRNNTATVDFTLDKPDTVSRLVFPENTGRFSKTLTLEFFDENGRKTGERKNIPLRRYDSLFGSSSADFTPAKAAAIRAVINRYTERKESEISTEFSGNFDLIVRKNVRNEEFNLNGLFACRAVSGNIPGKIRTSRVELPEIGREEKDGITKITADAGRVPCSGLKISADDHNYSRDVEIYSVGDGREKLLKRTSVTPETGLISIPETRGRYYVVKIRNADNAPLKNIRLEWNAGDKMLVIVPPKHGGMKLYYGGRAEKQIYDIEKYADRFGLPPQICELGEETDSPDFAPELPAEVVFKYMMWAAIAVAAAVLFIAIVRLLGKSRGFDESQN